MKFNNQTFVLLTVFVLFPSICFSQEYSKNSLKFGVGLGINEGKNETGVGGLIMFGYQKSVWKDRLRIGPAITTGSFFPFGITDVRDQYFRITTLGLNGYLDLLKYKGVSIFIGTGGFVNYTRGLLGTGGWYDEPISSSDYFFKIYYGGTLGGGIRIDPKKSKVAYEIAPLNVNFGNDYFMLGFFRIGIDVKINKRNSKKI